MVWRRMGLAARPDLTWPGLPPSLVKHQQLALTRMGTLGIAKHPLWAVRPYT